MNVHASSSPPPWPAPADRPAAPRIAALYLCDRGYHDLATYAIASLARAHRHPLHILWRQAGYDDGASHGLADFVARHGHQLSVTRFDSPPVPRRHEPGRRTFPHITPVANLKATCIDEASEAHDLVAYIDPDLLFFADPHFERLAAMEHPVAAARDISNGTRLARRDFAAGQREPGAAPDHFNSGLLMVNAAAWRGERLRARFAAAREAHERHCPYQEDCPHNDQCAFNMALHGRWLELPQSYNVQRRALQTRLWDGAVARHYTGPTKFLPIIRRHCDRREWRLLVQLACEARLPLDLPADDRGLLYALNRMRRARPIAHVERMLDLR